MTLVDADLDNEAAAEQILAVIREHKEDLLTKANVVGVAMGYRQKGSKTTDKLALVVMVSKKVPETQLNSGDHIPSSIDGVPIDVQMVGEITAV
jgi:hypothetical protein